MTLKDFWLGIVVAIPLDTALAVDIDAVIDRALRQQSIPGVSAAVVRDEKVIYAGGRGIADIASGRTMGDETVMYIGSLSKILTAVLALRQVECGALAMTDTLDRQPTITVRHMLTHQSGLRREGGFDCWFSGEFPDAPTLSAYVDRAPLEFEPGRRSKSRKSSFSPSCPAGDGRSS